MYRLPLEKLHSGMFTADPYTDACYKTMYQATSLVIPVVPSRDPTTKWHGIAGALCNK